MTAQPEHDIGPMTAARRRKTAYLRRLQSRRSCLESGFRVLGVCLDRLLNFDLYMKNADGAARNHHMQQQVDKWQNDWSIDGRYIVHTRGTDLWSSDYPELKTSLFLKAPSVFRNAQFSPDGKWVAYASNGWQVADLCDSFPEAHARGKSPP